MDRFGRRPLLLLGSVFMIISHFVIAVLVGKFSADWPSHRTEGWVSVAFLLFCKFTAALISVAVMLITKQICYHLEHHGVQCKLRFVHSYKAGPVTDVSL